MTMATRHPDATLTLSECFEKHYDRNALSGEGSMSVVTTHLRRWERDTDKPSVRDIDNVVVAGFCQTLIDAGCSPNYIRSMWITIRAVLRRIGPPVTGNPFGLGIIERIPAMKPVPRRHKLPRRVTMDELNHAYVAMKQMKLPRRGYPAAMFWQAFLVMAYTTGLRRGDLMAIRWEHVDVDRCTLFVSVSKTGVEAELPLHPAAIEHLQRIRSGGNPLVFGPVCERSFYDHWREIKSRSRRTAKGPATCPGDKSQLTSTDAQANSAPFN